jgi:hypothetical protein
MQAMKKSKVAWLSGASACTLLAAAACGVSTATSDPGFGTPSPSSMTSTGGSTGSAKPSAGSKTGSASNTGNAAAPNSGNAAPGSPNGTQVPTSPPASDTPNPVLAGVTPAAAFDTAKSLAAFKTTAYTLLSQNCANCHSESGSTIPNELPLVASTDPMIAHLWTLTRVDLRSIENSKLVTRLTIEAHNCWSDCTQDGATLAQALHAWADAISPLPVATVPAPSGQVTDAQVSAWIAADRGKLSSDDASNVAYTSLHKLYNAGASLDELNTARVGISKALNSTARYAPSIVNPVPIDPYALVYRFDTRDYWGYWPANPYVPVTGAAPADPAHAQTAWSRIKQGNVNGDFSAGGGLSHPDDKPSTFPNIAGFYSDYVEASQLVYTLTRPDVYNEIMNIPGITSPLTTQLGVDMSKGADGFQFMTVDNPITLEPRLLMRQSIGPGYFWKSTDPFTGSPMVWYERPVPEFDQSSAGSDMLKTTPLNLSNYSTSGMIVLNSAGTGLQDGLQAAAAEVIFSLPNGLQAYMIGGAGDEQRVDAFTFIVVDPRRGGPKTLPGSTPRTSQTLRLLQSASCFGCHDDGMNRAPDGMQPYLAQNPTKFDSATVTHVKTLYPGRDAMNQTLEADRTIFLGAMAKISNGMIIGMPGNYQGQPTADQTLALEPVLYMFEKAQSLYSYIDTTSN